MSVTATTYLLPMRVLTWNVERKKSTSPTGSAGVDLLRSFDADVMVITEARTSFPADDGHLVACEPMPFDYLDDDERRVVMWSKEPWTDVDTIGHPDFPIGRFVTGVTDSSIGPVRVVGVCIPWHMSNVQYGDQNRKPWEDHLRYLELLPGVLTAYDEPVIVAGDFNQCIPRVPYGNRAAAEAMATTFGPLDVVTAGEVDGVDKPLIDHIALGPGLSAERVWAWPNDAGGVRMSDHAGVGAEVIAR